MALQNAIHTMSVHCRKFNLQEPEFIKNEEFELSEGHQIAFDVRIGGQMHGTFSGMSCRDVKGKVALHLCHIWKLPHSGLPKSYKSKVKNKNWIRFLHEFCQTKGWEAAPIESQVAERVVDLKKTFEIRFTIAGYKFPSAIGPNIRNAKWRAAARALAVLTKQKDREFLRRLSTKPSFGARITNVAWETFKILCDEFGKSAEFCNGSNMSAFILENVKEDSLMCVAIGTGKSSANPALRSCNGESIIDTHGVVIARRSLLVFLYKQLCRLFKGHSSIFQYQNDVNNRKVAKLSGDYQLHLYMKEPPCGAASMKDTSTTYKKKKSANHVIIKYHGRLKIKDLERENLCINIREKKNGIVSCSDKILLWNFMGVQGSLLDSFIDPLYIDSITVSNKGISCSLVHAFCCRSEVATMTHPWLCQGSEIEYDIFTSLRNDCVSMYWTHGDWDLNRELRNLPFNGGFIDGLSGIHSAGTEQEGEIPMICKRYFYMLFSDVISCGGDIKREFLMQKSYEAIKSSNEEYKAKKKDFFQQAQNQQLGFYPKTENLDGFLLD